VFAIALENYRLFAPSLLGPLALGLPWLEITCGLALLFNRLVLGAALLSTVLTLGFVTALALAWWRGLDIDCGCFWSPASTDGMSHVITALARSIALLALAVWLLVSARQKTLAAPRHHLNAHRSRLGGMKTDNDRT
jgi:methylamine utilization protein MauE